MSVCVTNRSYINSVVHAPVTHLKISTDEETISERQVTFPRLLVEMVEDNLNLYVLISKFMIITTTLLLYSGFVFWVFSFISWSLFIVNFLRAGNFFLLYLLPYPQGLE